MLYLDTQLIYARLDYFLETRSNYKIFFFIVFLVSLLKCLYLLYYIFDLLQGGYFMVANWTELEKYSDLSQEPDPLKDYKFVKWLSKTKKLQGIPPSAFYSKEHKRLGENYIRFCFIKQDSNLKKADEILTKWKSER